MYATVIKKCLDVLNEEKPDISYAKGMLETLLAIQISESKESYPTSKPLSVPAGSGGGGGLSAGGVSGSSLDEGEMLDRMASTKITEIKALSDKSSLDV